MKISEINNYLNFVADRSKVSTDITSKETDIVKNFSTYSVKERAGKARKLIPPLEKAIEELKNPPTLSLQTPEVQESVLAYKNLLVSTMECKLERIKILASERDITSADHKKFLLIEQKQDEYSYDRDKKFEQLADVLKRDWGIDIPVQAQLPSEYQKKEREYNAFYRSVGIGFFSFLETNDAYFKIIQDRDSLSQKDRIEKAQDIFSEIHIAQEDLSNINSELTHQTPEERQMLLDWRKSVEACIAGRIEQLKILMKDAPLTSEDIDALAELHDQIGVNLHKSIDQQEAIVNHYRSNG